MFPWVPQPWDEELVLRCERCGMGSVGQGREAGDATAAAMQRLDRAGVLPNRASLAAWLGGGAWAALEPGAHHFFTPEALDRLGVTRQAGGIAVRMNVWLMWQTLLNSFTFGRNLGLGRLGRATPTFAGRGWQRSVDVVIVIATALPLLVAAAVVEGVARLAGRGGELRAGGGSGSP